MYGREMIMNGREMIMYGRERLVTANTSVSCHYRPIRTEISEKFWI